MQYFSSLKGKKISYPSVKLFCSFDPLMTRHFTRFFLLLSLLFISLTGFSQVVSGNFNKIYLRDNFTDNTLKWPILNNRDNFFVVQNGLFILERRNKESEYAVFNTYSDEPKLYSLNATFRISKQNPDGFAGVMFMTQTSGKGGFIIEINNKKQYRILQLQGSNYKLLTGEVKDEGWLKSKYLKGNDFNNIRILVKINKADIYLNNEYIASTEEPTYTNGKNGIMLGPSTKIDVKQWEVRIEDK